MADRPRRLVAFQRILLYVGAGGSLLLVIMAIGRGLSRVGARSGSPAELALVTALWIPITGWILSPYIVAWRLHRDELRTRGEDVILVAALLLMIALAANSFLATSTFVGGPPHPTADGVTVVFVPMAQWFLLGVAWVLMRVARAWNFR